jgi:hypothetical protein
MLDDLRSNWFKGRPRPRYRRAALIVFLYWLVASLGYDWGVRLTGSQSNWIGLVLLVATICVVLNWRAPKPLWLRVLVIPATFAFVAVIGFPLAVYMRKPFDLMQDPFLHLQLLIGATMPAFAFWLYRTRFCTREAEEDPEERFWW